MPEMFETAVPGPPPDPAATLDRSLRILNDSPMAEKIENVVDVAMAAAKLPDGVLNLAALTPEVASGCRIFVHYNGRPTSWPACVPGMAILDPGVSPHRRTNTPKKNS